jgi:beta-phosphoglucomutase family hydrolase
VAEANMQVFAIRHGETVWSLSGQHTGTTDIPLTNNGRRLAEGMRPVLAKTRFDVVLCSPMQRARETCELAGLAGKAVVDPDLGEWDYGEYEGLTPDAIHEIAPGWLIFRNGCPGGETPEQVGARVDRVIARSRAVGGDVALFAHGHVLRVLAARWIGLPAGGGEHFLLDTGTLCVLGYYRDVPAVRIWNGPLVDLSAAVTAPSPRRPASRRAITHDQYDAILFDLDGVITDTASIHALCWKQMFDEYLRERASRSGEAFRPFDLASDYRLYVDGKPRFDGVRDFLASRGIQLPEGNLDDSTQAETVCGLGNRKNDLVNAVIEDRGVEAYTGSVELIHQLRRQGFKIAVVTSSQNCRPVLKAAGLEVLFDVLVDGNTIHEQHLAGKPAPDTFLMAAKLLGAEPARTVVIEDAISGVQAGSNGNFGLVIGVARKGNVEELRSNGADLVVNDLGDLVDSSDPTLSRERPSDAPS